MNERDLFAAANAIADPAERSTLLERECANRPDLRRRIELLLNVPLDRRDASLGGGLSVTRLPRSADSPKARGPSKGTQRYDSPPSESPSFRTQLREFVATHRGVVIAGSLAAFVLATAAVWTVFGLLAAERPRTFPDATAERDRTAAANLRELETHQDPLAEARLKAENDRREALRVRDQALDALRTASTQVPNLIDDRRRLSPAARDYIETLARRWEAVVEGAPSDVEGRRLRADARLRAADLWRHLGRREEALAGYGAACRLLADVVELAPASADDRRRLASAYTSWGSALATHGRRDDALAAHNAAVACWRKLAADSPAEKGHVAALADSLFHRGNLLADRDDRAASLATWREAVAVQTTLVGQSPDRSEFVEGLARLHGGLGQVLHRFGQTEDAIAAARTARDLRKQTAERRPRVAEHQESLAAAQFTLATLLHRADRRDAAMTECRQALEIRRSLVARHPERHDLRRRRADTHSQLGALLSEDGKFAEALTEYQAALTDIRTLAAQDPGRAELQDRLAATHVSLGLTLQDLHRHEEAVTHYRLARDVRRGLCARFPEDMGHARGLAAVHHELLELLRQLGRIDEARAEYQAARAVHERLAARSPDDDARRLEFADTVAGYATLLLDEGKPADSVREFNGAIELLERRPASGDHEAAANEAMRRCLWGRAQAYAALRNSSRALRDADRVVQLCPVVERRSVLALRPGLRLTAGDAPGAIDDVEQLAREDAWTADQWFDFARIYGAASVLAPSQRDEYARRAVDLLKRAEKAGFTDATRAKHARDLASLRERADFQGWVAGLEAASKPSRP